VLTAGSHDEASRVRQSIDGKRMSVQAYHILPKVAEVDALLLGRPGDAARVHEVHPEVSFAAMNGRAGLAHGKKRKAGRDERLDLLTPAFSDAPRVFLDEYPRKRVAADDVLDAFAALWTARRLASGDAWTLPARPSVDRHGLTAAIYV